MPYCSVLHLPFVVPFHVSRVAVEIDLPSIPCRGPAASARLGLALATAFFRLPNRQQDPVCKADNLRSLSDVSC